DQPQQYDGNDARPQAKRLSKSCLIDLGGAHIRTYFPQGLFVPWFFSQALLSETNPEAAEPEPGSCGCRLFRLPESNHVQFRVHNPRKRPDWSCHRANNLLASQRLGPRDSCGDVIDLHVE